MKTLTGLFLTLSFASQAYGEKVESATLNCEVAGIEIAMELEESVVFRHTDKFEEFRPRKIMKVASKSGYYEEIDHAFVYPAGTEYPGGGIYSGSGIIYGTRINTTVLLSNKLYDFRIYATENTAADLELEIVAKHYVNGEKVSSLGTCFIN